MSEVKTELMKNGDEIATKKEIRDAYRFILRREPESLSTIEAYYNKKMTFNEVRDILWNSIEFKQLFYGLNNEVDVKETFKNIYATNLWGGEEGTFYSGRGSDEDFAEDYANTINNFIRKHGIKSIVDCGCGDFRVGKKLCNNNIKYLGIDIVDDLISYNQKAYASENTSFICKNIIDDELPISELCLIRQVLQHLSNLEILKVIKNVDKYKYIIVTEHIPEENDIVSYNLDKCHGENIRLANGSGVFLEKPPFNLKMMTLAEFRAEDVSGVLRTSLIVK